MIKDRLGKTLKPPAGGGTKKKHSGYVFISIKKGQRDGLNALKKYGDTYDTIIQILLNDHYNRVIEDHAAQNVDHKDGDDEERGA